MDNQQFCQSTRCPHCRFNSVRLTTVSISFTPQKSDVNQAKYWYSYMYMYDMPIHTRGSQPRLSLNPQSRLSSTLGEPTSILYSNFEFSTPFHPTIISCLFYANLGSSRSHYSCQQRTGISTHMSPCVA